MSDGSPRNDAPAVGLATAVGLAPRRLAWEVLEAVAAGAYADVALERALRGQSLSAADRGLMTELAYGAIRQRRWLDAWVDGWEKYLPASSRRACVGCSMWVSIRSFACSASRQPLR